MPTHFKWRADRPVMPAVDWLTTRGTQELTEQHEAGCQMDQLAKQIEGMALDMNRQSAAAQVLNRYLDLVRAMLEYESIKTPFPHDSNIPRLPNAALSILLQIPQLQQNKSNDVVVEEKMKLAEGSISRIKNEISSLTKYIQEIAPHMYGLYCAQKGLEAQESDDDDDDDDDEKDAEDSKGKDAEVSKGKDKAEAEKEKQAAEQSMKE